MRPEAIVFDFDLTLADSMPAFVACHQHAARTLDLPPPTAEAVGRTIGTPLPLGFRKLYGIDDDALAARYIHVYQAHADLIMTDLTVMLPGATETIRRLAADGFRLGIVSQKRRYRIDDVLRREGLLPLFGAVLGDEDVPAFKPDPRGLMLAVERLNGTPATSLYVGDTVIDAETAQRAGIAFVAVLSGETTADEFAPYDWLGIIAGIADLPDVLLLDATAGRP